MVIVQLTGGLGNQLFQYAMGRCLALDNSVEMKIDLSFFPTYEWHAYSLSPFAIKSEQASAVECERLKLKHARWYNRLRRVVTGKSGRYVVYEDTLRYNPIYTNLKPPVYLHGYWQCEEYFIRYENIIRQDLTILRAPSAPNRELLKKIISTNSISLHIRRGNFVNVEHVNKIHGTCSMDYYDRAIAYFNDKITTPIFFVFSDDIAWAKENLSDKANFEFVDINDATNDFEDLRLMSKCKHHIIANSTFSWWGAWLNTNADKIVVAPTEWFADKKKNEEAVDILPSQWLRL